MLIEYEKKNNYMLVGYEIEYWDEIIENSNTDIGITSCDKYETAVKQIVSYYGEKNIISLKIQHLEPILTKDEIQLLFKQD